MKKYIRTLCAVLSMLCVFGCTVLAAESQTERSLEIVPLEDGYYLEIVTTVEYPSVRASSIHGMKDFHCKSADGKLVFTYTLNGTFEYDSRTSSAINGYGSATIYQSGWSMKSHNKTCSGSTVRGTATFSGPSGSKTLSGSITCDKNGNIS